MPVSAAAAGGPAVPGAVSRVPSLLDYASTLARPTSGPPAADLHALFPPVSDPWGGDDEAALAAAGQPGAVCDVFLCFRSCLSFFFSSASFPFPLFLLLLADVLLIYIFFFVCFISEVNERPHKVN